VVSAVNAAHDDVPAEDEVPGRAIDPQLLALIQRVAHREHLLDGIGATPPGRPHDNSLTRPGRRRPAMGSSVRRTPRGTTARKVTWSP
jgi:hypothetical protein